MYPVFGNEPDYVDSPLDRLEDLEVYLEDNLFFSEGEIQSDPDIIEKYKFILTPICKPFCEDLSQLNRYAFDFDSNEYDGILEDGFSLAKNIYRLLRATNLFDPIEFDEVTQSYLRYTKAFEGYKMKVEPIYEA